MQDAVIIDLARSPAYRKGYLWFASGPELARDLTSTPGDGPIVPTLPNGTIAAASTETLYEAIFSLP